MITKEDVLKAQDNWAQAIVEIGSLKDNQAACEKITTKLLDELYAFYQGDILFKPTKASAFQFRPNKVAALSYFIGNNSSFPEDTGFALQPWTHVRFDNTGFLLKERSALAMGNYYFTDLNGGETKVEYTFAYIKDDTGKLKIELHHSSIPYAPAT